ncbi:hypothetical protein HOLleu_26635 [Holothuria leucospilota]|uniref:Uncharacterized protein n=1 Tax=Holothuria leucospilota TaxID=206669 RepID=A0A9Q1H2N0_HOLLE|nr:hypothetical protein HOLleu_26635 [Holothuria leucospilota]
MAMFREPPDYEAFWFHSGVPGNSSEAREATGDPKFLSTPKHHQRAIEMRVGGQRPLTIEVQRRYGGQIDTFRHNGPGSIIRVENVDCETDVSYVHISNDFGRVTSNVTTMLGMW